jgi:hypothetical protein
VLHQLRADGVLDDLTKINALLSVARQYVITDAGWNLLDFISQMRGIHTADITFRTLPIVGYQTIDGQDANVINVSQIQREVHAVFYPAPKPPSARSSGARPAASADAAGTTVDVYNGGQTQGLAAEVSAALVKEGYKAGRVANTSPLATTEVRYGSGSAASAGTIASLFGVSATASPAVAAHTVQILLGADATMPDIPASSAPASGSPSSVSPSVVPTSGPQGGAVKPTEDGIPCVN